MQAVGITQDFAWCEHRLSTGYCMPGFSDELQNECPFLCGLQQLQGSFVCPARMMAAGYAMAFLRRSCCHPASAANAEDGMGAEGSIINGIALGIPQSGHVAVIILLASLPASAFGTSPSLPLIP